MPGARPKKSKSGRSRKGTGALFERADGTWVARAELGYTGEGKRQRLTLYGKSEREAADKLKRALREIDEGRPLAPERLTVKAWLDTWLAEYATPRVRATTAASYEEICRLHLIPALGNLRLKALRPDEVQRALNAKLAARRQVPGRPEDGITGEVAAYSPRRVALMRAVLKMALGQALKNDLITRNPAAMTYPPKQERHEIKRLSVEQGQTLLKAAYGGPLDCIVTLALTMGLRQGEILGLRWSDVDFDARKLKVSTALHAGRGGAFELVPPKTEKSRRVLTLPSRAVEALRRARSQQAADQLRAGGEWHNE